MSREAAERRQAELARKMKADRTARAREANRAQEEREAREGPSNKSPYIVGGHIDILKGSGKHYGGYGN